MFATDTMHRPINTETLRPLYQATRPLSEMSLPEIEAERRAWQERIDRATGWGSSLEAARRFKLACEAEITRRTPAPEKRT